jgi:hypothetical protein
MLGESGIVKYKNAHMTNWPSYGDFNRVREGGFLYDKSGNKAIPKNWRVVRAIGETIYPIGLYSPICLFYTIPVGVIGVMVGGIMMLS